MEETISSVLKLSSKYFKMTLVTTTIKIKTLQCNASMAMEISKRIPSS